LKRRQPNYDYGETKLAGLHPNLNYILAIEMTSRGWKGKEQSTVKGGVAMAGVQNFLPDIVSLIK